MKKIYLFLILGIFLITIISSSSLGTFKKGNCISIYQLCDNCSYVNLSSITYPNSSILILDIDMTKSNVNYNYSFCNTNTLGDYSYKVCGDKDGEFICEDISFKVTYNGDELDTSKSILYIGLLIFLIFFFILLIYFAGKLPNNENTNENGELISISNLKYIGSTLLFFSYLILVAIFYVTSSLAYAYLGETLFAKILFTIFQILSKLILVIIIVWVVWIFAQIIQDKRMRKLIEHGIYPTNIGGKW